MFPYSSPLPDLFNPAIDRIIDAGVMEHLFDLYLPFRKETENIDLVATSEVPKLKIPLIVL